MKARKIHHSLIVAAGSALLLVAGCSDEEGGAGGPEWDPLGGGHGYEVVLGTARPQRSYHITRWFGRPEAGPEAPPILGDTRDSLLVSTPSRILVDLGVSEHPRFFRAAVRRTGSSAALTCEVFFRQGTSIESLARADLPADGGPASGGWHDLDCVVPSTAGSLEFVTRYSEPGLATQTGPAVAWARPRISAGRPPGRPDVLLLTIDAFRTDALQSAPELLALLEQGAIWTNAISPSIWTLPSYAALFTNRNADEHGAGRGPFAARATGEREDRGFRPLRPDLPTLAEAFRDAGYATCMLHQNPFLEPWTGMDRGFERYARVRDDTETAVMVAREWWQRSADRPRFLVLHLMAPHLPYRGPGADPLAGIDWRRFLQADHTPQERRDFFALDLSDRDLVRARYLAEITAIDHIVAPWIAGLFDQPRALVFAFHTDHGEELWDEGSFEHGHAFSDSVARVPLAVVAPGLVEPRWRREVVRVMDLGPTLLGLVGAPRPSGWTADLFAGPREARCLRPLYRAEIGGRVYHADGSIEDLPFDPDDSAEPAGEPVTLPAEVERALAELGYAAPGGDGD